MIGQLPTTLEVGDTEHKIRSDYRDILVILSAFGDPDLTEAEKVYVMLSVLFEDQDWINRHNYKEAMEKASWFIDCGSQEGNNTPKKKLMDWEQDEKMLFSAINKTAGMEVRALEYMHWWTFMGYFMEIDGGVFSTVIGIRQKRAKNRRLEKWEMDFYRAHRDMCDLKTRYSKEEQEEIAYLNKLLG